MLLAHARSGHRARWYCADPGGPIPRTPRQNAAMAERDEGQTGVLTLAAVPIGRAEDASPRLAAELARATVIAAEDTRRVRWLAAGVLGRDDRGPGEFGRQPG